MEGLDPLPAGKRPYALLTILYHSTHRLFRAGAHKKYQAHNSSVSIEAESVP